MPHHPSVDMRQSGLNGQSGISSSGVSTGVTVVGAGASTGSTTVATTATGNHFQNFICHNPPRNATWIVTHSVSDIVPEPVMATPADPSNEVTPSAPLNDDLEVMDKVAEYMKKKLLRLFNSDPDNNEEKSEDFLELIKQNALHQQKNTPQIIEELCFHTYKTVEIMRQAEIEEKKKTKCHTFFDS